MAAENFKVKKGLEVGTGITANSDGIDVTGCLLYTSPSPRDDELSRMPSSA